MALTIEEKAALWDRVVEARDMKYGCNGGVNPENCQFYQNCIESDNDLCDCAISLLTWLGHAETDNVEIY